MTEYVFICPRCAAVRDAPGQSRMRCERCQQPMVNTGITDEQWRAMPPQERQRRIDSMGIPGIPAIQSELEETPTGVVEGKKGGPSGLMILSVIEMVFFGTLWIATMAYHAPLWVLWAILFFVTSVEGAILGLSSGGCHFTATTESVKGLAGWKRQVDLPLDSITGTAMDSGDSIIIATPTGKYRFWHIEDHENVFRQLNELLAQREPSEPQPEPARPATAPLPPAPAQEPPVDLGEELMKYKRLLDMGLITEADFDAKKRQLLGL